MSSDPTEIQGRVDRQRAAEMSLKRGSLPVEVPGYEPERFLGIGAYGEVWVARERNTGRRVAVKFYAHRGGLDWSLLSREVEKLAFLFADRYVVQLLGVGWDSDPPYYIMEYLEKGSLADRIARGPLPVDEALALFRDVATGLVHAHGKGVLHCDLKPANVLLDHDGKPRLADFGQSRLSTEQAPALGTMFYMAPEQADLNATPDARWDVYALGALLYCMLTGSPPHGGGKTADIFKQTPDLRERLAHYRRTIEGSPTPTGHRRRHGVDKSLAAIVDRCLAPDPEKRFPNVQAVIDALDERAARRARRPMLIVGAVGPALLLAVVAWFAYRGFSGALRESDKALTAQALEGNRFAVQFAARTASNELEKRYGLVEQLVASKDFRRRISDALADPELNELLARLADPNIDPDERESLRKRFLANPARRKLQREFESLLPATMLPSGEEEVASWFFCDAGGVSTVRVPEGRTIGKNFAWRSYFHGGPKDLADYWRPAAGEHLEQTTLSDVFRSQATARWIVAVSAPVFDLSPERKFIGVAAMTVEVGRFVDFPYADNRFAVLVDNRVGGHKGVILQHPLFDKLLAKEPKLPDRCQYYRVSADSLPDTAARQEDYEDPLAADADGGEFDRRWLARMEEVRVRDADTGWVVIVQEDYETAIDVTLSRLKRGLLHSGIVAMGLVALVMAGLWGMAKKMGKTI